MIDQAAYPDDGRIKLIRKLAARYQGLMLSVGCGFPHMGDVNIDIDPSVKPDVIGDARFLPFRAEAFNVILFTDVIEHLDKGSEFKALGEIQRVLKSNGIMILSTPNDCTLFNILDLARFFTIHRHYKVTYLLTLLKRQGFRIIRSFSAGSIFEMLCNLWYCMFTYPFKKLFKVRARYAPSYLLLKQEKEYGKNYGNSGYTIFVIAEKL